MYCEDKKCLVYIECMERLETLPYCASKAAELATTANKQLKAEIASLVSEFIAKDKSRFSQEVIDLVTKLRQLSAV